jgi:hypothetical protein
VAPYKQGAAVNRKECKKHMTISGGFITKIDEHYVLIGKGGAYKITRLAALMVDDVDFIPSYKLSPNEAKLAKAVLN